MLNPTAYPQVNTALTEYLAALRAGFGDELLSVYLLGSLSTSSYVPGWSDVNGVAVVKQGDPAQLQARIQVIRQTVLDAHPQWSRLLFACCVPMATLRQTNWRNQPEGWSLLDLTNLVEDGLLIWGQEIGYDLERPTLEELRAGLVAELARQLESPAPLPRRAPRGDEWNSYRQSPTQIVDWLIYPTRVLLTWDKGRVGSKPEAVNHYIEEYHGPWEPVLLQADTLRRTGSLDALTPETLMALAGQTPGLFEWLVKRLLSILFLPPDLADAGRNLRRWLERDPSLPRARPGQTYDIVIPDRKPWLRKGEPNPGEGIETNP